MANAKRCIPRDKARLAAKAVLPPIIGIGWVGEDRVGKEGGAELGDGFVASVVADEGAINPYEQSCGRVRGLPPPCSQRVRSEERNVPPEPPPKASCSPVGGEGRLVPTSLLKVALAKTVEAPARMPALGGATTPSCGGREGIVRTGVSRSSEANPKNASL